MVQRRFLMISWVDKFTDGEILNSIKRTKQTTTIVKCHKLSYFGHIMTQPEKYKVLYLIFCSKLLGKLGYGRRRASWRENLFRKVVDKTIVVKRITVMGQEVTFFSTSPSGYMEYRIKSEPYRFLILRWLGNNWQKVFRNSKRWNTATSSLTWFSLLAKAW